jgi:hypothetical protein
MGRQCEFAGSRPQAQAGQDLAVTHRIVIAILLAAIGLGIGAFAWHNQETARAEQVRKRTAVLITPDAAVEQTDHYPHSLHGHGGTGAARRRRGRDAPVPLR